MSQEPENKPNQESKKKGSRRESIKDYIEIVLFLGLAILLVFSFNWILGAALHTDTPLVIVTSESMEPIYYGSNRREIDLRKDMLVVRGVDPSEIKVGDVIVFYQYNTTTGENIVDDPLYEPIVHRVNRIYIDNVTGEYWFTTKGDNPLHNDAFINDPNINELQINQDRVIGKIIGRIPYLGGIIAFFKTTTGLIVLISVIAVVLLATFFLSPSGEKDEDVFDGSLEGEPKKEKLDDDTKQVSFKDKLKQFYRKTMKYKHIVFPSLVLLVIVIIPLADTLAANWGSEIGVVSIVDDGSREYIVKDGTFRFAYADVTINNPGHWRFKLRYFTIELLNATTNETLGSNNWTAVYNFEGLKTVTTGVWLDPTDVTVGLQYTFRVTALIQTKFGNVFTSSLIHTFTLSEKIS
ncbi:MAG: signal peptidase I [Asgard group archaeon]|nr:signal peptidase I [Asgard group archaeon]